MSREIFWSETAHEDAFRIFHNIRQDDLDAAVKFYHHVDKTLDQLLAHPEIGVDRVYKKAGAVSMIPIDRPYQKYLLFYQYDDDELVVLRVFRGSQNIAFFLGVLE